ncbi:hypothetical protein Vadar_003832 [Vaccinium darrowii]|uniref:Uncharacterized protein n=1 Tax=Vaccinium darrowii TaxID=229202 RepID=A0ACB7Z1I9_9ERIC|nr:hypothetical protein Vadar_003832 [Vaccinium darrowii]
MASNSISYIFSFLLLFSCIWTQLFADSNEKAKQNNDLVEKVCSKVVWPNFCLETLRPYPGSATADLSGIATISVDLALSNGSKAKSLINKLSKLVRDPTNKTVLNDCSNYFDVAIGDINAAKNYLVAKDYVNANTKAALAGENIYDCLIILDDGPSRELSTWTSNEFDYCNILCETSGLLLGGQEYDYSNEKAKQNNDLIEKVCSRVVWPNFCLETLRPYPGSATADLSGIAMISVDLALSNGSKAKSLISELYELVSDPTNETVLNDCSNYFDVAIGDINAAKNYLYAEDYVNANTKAALASEIIYDCLIILDDGPSRELSTWTSNEFNYCNILCETSGLLLGGQEYDCA